MINDEEFSKMLRQVQSLYEYHFGPEGTAGFGQAEQDKVNKADIALLKKTAHVYPCPTTIETQRLVDGIFKRLVRIEVEVAALAGGTGVGIGLTKALGLW